MKTYEEALFDVHKALLDDIDHNLPFLPSEYISGMLDAARIVLNMMKNETIKKEGK